MGTYNLPRNVKGEGRILFIFTGKSMLYTVIGGGVGLAFAFIFSLMKMNFVGVIFIAFWALIGFIIGTFKMPDLAKFKFSQKTGGENLDDVIKRAIKFKTKGKRIYIYKEEKRDAR